MRRKLLQQSRLCRCARLAPQAPSGEDCPDNGQRRVRMHIAEIDRELDHARSRGAVRDIAIPPCPELLLALRQEVGLADPDPAEIARIAASDVAMAASLLRTVNSPLYARARPADTVAQAVAMLGVGPTVGILTSFLTRNAIRSNSPLLAHFWESSTRRALAMGFIARQLYGVDADVAHTCGLFCHVGIPIMMMGVKGYAGTLAEALARQDRSFTETENAAHQTDHAVVGAIVAKTWRLPAITVAAVRLHHDFTVLTDASFPAEVRTLVAMGLVSESLVARHEGVQVHREWEQHGAACLACLHVAEEEVDAWVDTLHPLFEGVSFA
jgi:HD-like signal output (HDOD) protein